MQINKYIFLKKKHNVIKIKAKASISLPEDALLSPDKIPMTRRSRALNRFNGGPTKLCSAQRWLRKLRPCSQVAAPGLPLTDKCIQDRVNIHFRHLRKGPNIRFKNFIPDFLPTGSISSQALNYPHIQPRLAPPCHSEAQEKNW